MQLTYSVLRAPVLMTSISLQLMNFLRYIPIYNSIHVKNVQVGLLLNCINVQAKHTFFFFVLSVGGFRGK